MHQKCALFSEENNFRIYIEFLPSVNLVDAANDVREAVSRIVGRLPDASKTSESSRRDADASPIMRIAVSSARHTIEDLSRIVEDKIITKLIAIDGVADVTQFGERKRVLRVLLDPLRLASYRLAISDVAAVLKAAHRNVTRRQFQVG